MSAASYVWFQGVWFEMPFGYHNPWPSGDHASRALDRETYIEAISENSQYSGYVTETGAFDLSLLEEETSGGSYAFWMPSGRWVERNIGWAGGTLRPCEAGRPPPSENEFVVRFWIEAVGLNENNLDRLPHRLSRQLELSRQDEWMYPTYPGPYQPTASTPVAGDRSYFIFQDDDGLWVFLRCSEYLEVPEWRNRTCNGYAIDWTSGVALRIGFPSDQGQFELEERWREPVEAAIQLLDEWRR